MNYLFLILGKDAFYEAMIMMKIIDQMPLDCGIYCMSSELYSMYFRSDERIFNIIMQEGDLDENKKLFEDIINDGKITTVFIMDYHKTFFTDDYQQDYKTIPFKLEWLESITIPINLIDYLDALEYNEHNQVYLSNSSSYNFEEEYEVPVDAEKDAIYEQIFMDSTAEIEEITIKEKPPKEDMVSKTNIFPNIIKLCPPAQSQKENDFDKFIFLNYSIADHTSLETERMKPALGMTPGKKNVVVFFSYQLLLKSVVEGKGSHYSIVLETLVIYLKKLNIEVNLFVIASDNLFIQKSQHLKGSKINFRAFSDLSHHVYKTLISYADIVITDTVWHPALVDASSLNIPAGVIGNSVKIQNDGSVHSDFATTDLKVMALMEKSIQDFPQIFFPYNSFPLKLDFDPEFTFYNEKFIYYLLDIFSDESVESFLGEFLVSKSEILEELNNRQFSYNKRAELSLRIDEVLQKFDNRL